MLELNLPDADMIVLEERLTRIGTSLALLTEILEMNDHLKGAPGRLLLARLKEKVDAHQVPKIHEQGESN